MDPLSPNMERLELAGQDANEALIPAPRALLYPKYTPPVRETDLRTILLADPTSKIGFYLRYYAAQDAKEKEKDRDTALPAERERPNQLGRFN